MSNTIATINITGDIGKGYAVGGGSCGCTPATMEEVLEALLEADSIPALMVDDAALCIDDKILVV